jgi:hypothetical protein
MNDHQPAKGVFIMKPEGSRAIGRPCSRWADNIDMDIRTIGGRNWKAIVSSGEDFLGRLWLIKGCDTKDGDDDLFC